MHTQRKAARFVVGNGGHYIFGVKENQPRLWNAAVDADEGIDSEHPQYESCTRGHGRIDRHRVWAAPVPYSMQFPHAGRYIIIERESSTLDDVRTSIETRYYVTDLVSADASVEHLFRLTKGHWGTSSLHWVRDVTFNEDRSQVRTGTPSHPRDLAQFCDRHHRSRDLPLGQHRSGNPPIRASARSHARPTRHSDRTLQMTVREPPALLG
jgi:hypothetical protein